MSVRVYDTLDPYRRVVGNLPVLYRGQPLDKSDADLLRFALCLRTALLYDLLDNADQGLNAAYRAVCNLKYLDAYVLGNDIKSLSKALRQYCEDDTASPVTIKSFTRSLGLTYTDLIVSGIRPSLENFLTTRSVESFTVILQYVDFLVKLNFRSADLEDDMLKDYRDQERLMDEWTYDDELLSSLESIVHEWFYDLDQTFLLDRMCKHSTGATAQLVSSHKSRLVKGGAPHLTHECYQSMIALGIDDRFVVDDVSMTSFLPSEVVFVPKSMVTNRVISKEDTSLQYLQQGLKQLFYGYFREHHYLSRIIDLEDQTKSQSMACEGSRTGKYCTIDLSSASDSVHVELVAALFSGLPRLYRGLMDTRSQYASYKMKRTAERLYWRLNKFAPMGSGLCFPIETIVFAAVCELARRRGRHRTLFRVYGDDLVVPTEYATDVVDLLGQLHFTVNKGKSFMNRGRTMFREACGGEYLCGTAVTPVRLSRQLRLVSAVRRGGKIIQIEAGLDSQVGLANRLYEAGFEHARSYTLRSLRLTLGDEWYFAVGFSSDDSRIRVADPDNRNAKCRWNRDLQRLEYLLTTSTYDRRAVRRTKIELQNLVDPDVGDLEYARLEDWLVEAELRPSHGDWPAAFLDHYVVDTYGISYVRGIEIGLQLRPPQPSLGSVLCAPRTVTRAWNPGW